MEKKQAIEELIKRGATEYSDVTIVSVLPSDSEYGIRLSLTLDKPIPAYVRQGEDFVEGASKNVFVFFGTTVKLMTEDKDCAKIYPYLRTNVLETASLLAGAKIKVMCENVEKDDDYINPFSDNTEPTPVKRTTIFHHIVDLQLDEDAKEDAKEIRKEIRRGIIKFTNDD